MTTSELMYINRIQCENTDLRREEESLRNGEKYRKAMDADLLLNHISHYGVTPVPLPMFPYHFGISPEAAKGIMEVYNYEISDRKFK